MIKHFYSNLILSVLLLCASNALLAQMPVTIHWNTGAFATEPGFAIVNTATGAVVYCEPTGGTAPTAVNDLILPTGSYELQMFDAFGDGWNGGYVTVYAQNAPNNVLFQGGLFGDGVALATCPATLPVLSAGGTGTGVLIGTSTAAGNGCTSFTVGAATTANITWPTLGTAPAQVGVVIVNATTGLVVYSEPTTGTVANALNVPLPAGNYQVISFSNAFTGWGATPAVMQVAITGGVTRTFSRTDGGNVDLAILNAPIAGQVLPIPAVGEPFIGGGYVLGCAVASQIATVPAALAATITCPASITVNNSTGLCAADLTTAQIGLPVTVGTSPVVFETTLGVQTTLVGNTPTLPTSLATTVSTIAIPAGQTTAVAAGFLRVYYKGNFQTANESVAVLDENGVALTTIGGTGVSCGAFENLQIVPLSAAQLNAWLADGTTTFTLPPDLDIDPDQCTPGDITNNNYVRYELDYPFGTGPYANSFTNTANHNLACS
jgi:hypothetical protein